MRLLWLWKCSPAPWCSQTPLWTKSITQLLYNFLRSVFFQVGPGLRLLVGSVLNRWIVIGSITGSWGTRTLNTIVQFDSVFAIGGCKFLFLWRNPRVVPLDLALLIQKKYLLVEGSVLDIAVLVPHRKMKHGRVVIAWTTHLCPSRKRKRPQRFSRAIKILIYE